MYVSAHIGAGACGDQRHDILMELGLQGTSVTPHGHLELSLGPPQEKHVLLTVEPSLSSLLSHVFKGSYLLKIRVCHQTRENRGFQSSVSAPSKFLAFA